MKIFLVVRWGNNEEGPNGEDTSFLIVATDHLEAANLADSILSELKCEIVCVFSNDIFELGAISFKAHEPMVLVGPVVKYFNIPNMCKNWVRYEIEDSWHEVEKE